MGAEAGETRLPGWEVYPVSTSFPCLTAFMAVVPRRQSENWFIHCVPSVFVSVWSSAPRHLCCSSQLLARQWDVFDLRGGEMNWYFTESSWPSKNSWLRKPFSNEAWTYFPEQINFPLQICKKIEFQMELLKSYLCRLKESLRFYSCFMANNLFLLILPGS